VYVRKEGVSRPTPMEARRSGGVWVVLGILALLLFLAMFWLLATNSESMKKEAHRTALGEATKAAPPRMTVPSLDAKPAPPRKVPPPRMVVPSVEKKKEAR